MSWRFEDYQIETGYTNVGRVPFAALREFFALAGTGATHAEAVDELRRRYEERLAHLRAEGEPIPAPGAGPGRARFASDAQVRALGGFVAEFWQEILGTSVASSYVSDESRLSVWEHYVGGREPLLARIRARYGVDAAPIYDAPVPQVLAYIRAQAV